MTRDIDLLFWPSCTLCLNDAPFMFWITRRKMNRF